MKLEIRNQQPSTFPIPEYRFLEGALKRRIGVTERFGKAGSFLAGDRQWAGRTTSLIGDINDTTDAGFIAEFAKLVEIFDNRFNPYFVVDTENDRRIEVELDTLNPSGGEALVKKLTNVRMRLFLPEVAWEDLDEKTETSPSAGTGTGETIEVTNGGQLETYPVITVVPIAKNTKFTLFNNTIEDLITIQSNAFTVGTSIEIDAINGTVFLNDGTTRTEISSSVADRTGFFFLARGLNVISYESPFGKVDISIAFRNRFLF